MRKRRQSLGDERFVLTGAFLITCACAIAQAPASKESLLSGNKKKHRMIVKKKRGRNISEEALKEAMRISRQDSIHQAE